MVTALQVPTNVLCEHFREYAKILVTAHSTAPESNCDAAYKKYSRKKMGGVALRPPAIGICVLNADLFDAYDKLQRSLVAIQELFFAKPAKISSAFSLIKKEETIDRDQNGKRGQLKGHGVTSPRTKRLRKYFTPAASPTTTDPDKEAPPTTRLARGRPVRRRRPSRLLDPKDWVLK